MHQIPKLTIRSSFQMQPSPQCGMDVIKNLVQSNSSGFDAEPGFLLGGDSPMLPPIALISFISASYKNLSLVATPYTRSSSTPSSSLNNHSDPSSFRSFTIQLLKD
nr:hypothetical protein Itr_chr04CG13200 [Ipomoea trifida]